MGWGIDCSIRELTEKIAETVGYLGTLKWDSTQPDGTPRKLLDTSKLKELGWTPKISIEERIKQVVDWTLKNDRWLKS